MATPILEVFTDYVCPWCYLAEKRISELNLSDAVEIKYTFFPLHPDTPRAGRSLVNLFKGRGLDVGQSQERLRQQMLKEGLAFGVRTHTYNSRDAQELAKWAGETGCLDALNREVFHAYFGDGLNIADFSVLERICKRAGLNPNEGAEVLQEKTYAPALDADWNRCRDLQIHGVPAFVNGDQILTGCQPVSALRNLIRVVQNDRTD